MKRMIDNKDYETLKENVNDINEELELKDTNYIITSVVVDDGKVLGSQVKDVENDTSYNLPLGTQVEANPTLESGEDELESIEIDGTKYKVGGGKQLYQHNVRIKFGSNYYELFLQITNDNPNTMFTDLASIVQYLVDNGHTTESSDSDMDTNFLRASGRVRNEFQSVDIKQVEGIYHKKSLTDSIYAVGYNDSTSLRDIQVTTGIGNLTIKEFIKAL